MPRNIWTIAHYHTPCRTPKASLDNSNISAKTDTAQQKPPTSQDRYQPNHKPAPNQANLSEARQSRHSLSVDPSILDDSSVLEDPKNEKSVQNFLDHVAAINRSEIAEHNYGKPNNLAQNPFKSHWETLDRECQALQRDKKEFFDKHPGTTKTDYVKKFSERSHFPPELEGYRGKPDTLSKQVDWVDRMATMNENPKVKLSTAWDALPPYYKKIMNKASQFKAKHPSKTIQDFVDAYNKKYDQTLDNLYASQANTTRERIEKLNEKLEKFRRKEAPEKMGDTLKWLKALPKEMAKAKTAKARETAYREMAEHFILKP